MKSKNGIYHLNFVIKVLTALSNKVSKSSLLCVKGQVKKHEWQALQLMKHGQLSYGFLGGSGRRQSHTWKHLPPPKFLI